jgi:hypothetical protein
MQFRNRVNRIKQGRPADFTALSRRPRATAPGPRVVRAFLRRTDASAPPWWTGTHPGPLRPPKTPYAAPTHGNGPGRATRRATVRPRAAASMQRPTWPLPQSFAPYPYTGRAASPRSARPCSVSRAPGPEPGRAEPSRARPPPTVAATAASSGYTRIRRPLLLFSPPATIPVAGAPPGRETRRHAGLQRAQPCCGSLPAASPAWFAPQIDACEPPKYSGQPLRPSPAATGRQSRRRQGPVRPGVTLQERRYFQGDLCKFPGTRL